MKRSVDHDGGSVGKKACNECTSSALNQLVRLSLVPEYLRESEFFKSLNIEDDEEFHLPANCMKKSMSVETFQDACDLLETIRFWGVKDSLLPVVQFAIKQPVEDIKRELLRFGNEFPFVDRVIEVLSIKNEEKKRMEAAMASGVIELVQCMEQTVPIFTMQALASAAAAGHVKCLQYALSRNWDGSFKDAGCVYYAAVESGQLDCFKFLSRSCLSFDVFKSDLTRPDIPYWYRNLAIVACENGQLACLQFLHVTGFSLAGCVPAAAAGGYLSCLQYSLEHVPTTNLMPAAVRAVRAVINDHAQCFSYLHGLGCPLTNYRYNLTNYSVAAINSSLHCLQYLYECGCELDPATCQTAALNGHLSCLKYAFESGVPFIPTSNKSLVPYRREFCERYEVDLGPSYLVTLVAMREH